MTDFSDDQIDRMRTVRALVGDENLPAMLEIINKSMHYAIGNTLKHLEELNGDEIAHAAKMVRGAVGDVPSASRVPPFEQGSMCGFRVALVGISEVMEQVYPLQGIDWPQYAIKLKEIVETNGGASH